jgi:hypothetical protein
MKNISTLTFIVALTCLFTVVAFAQPGGGGPTTPTPIDGGVGLLIAAGAAYGYYKKKMSS